MVRSVDTFFINGESFINYCSDSDFNYTIYIGQKCKVLRNGKCFIGTLYKVNSNKKTFSIKQNNGEIITINHLLCQCLHLIHSGHLGLSVLLVEIHCLRNKL